MVAFISPPPSSAGRCRVQQTYGAGATHTGVHADYFSANGHDLLQCALQGLHIFYSWDEQKTAEESETEGMRRDKAEQPGVEREAGAGGQAKTLNSAALLNHVLNVKCVPRARTRFFGQCSFTHDFPNMNNVEHTEALKNPRHRGCKSLGVSRFDSIPTLEVNSVLNSILNSNYSVWHQNRIQFV